MSAVRFRLEPPFVLSGISKPIRCAFYRRVIHGGLAKWPNAGDCKSLPSGSVVRIHHPPPVPEPLAQLVEHLTFNQGVVGSSPTWLTSLEWTANAYAFAFFDDTEFIIFTLILVCIVSDKNAFVILRMPQAFLLVLSGKIRWSFWNWKECSICHMTKPVTMLTGNRCRTNL